MRAMTSRTSYGLRDVGVDDAVQLVGRRSSGSRGAATSSAARLTPVQRADDRARDRQRMVIVLREVIGDARDARVHVGAAQLLGADDLAGRGLHQRRPAEEDRALLAAR